MYKVLRDILKFLRINTTLRDILKFHRVYKVLRDKSKFHRVYTTLRDILNFIEYMGSTQSIHCKILDETLTL